MKKTIIYIVIIVLIMIFLLLLNIVKFTIKGEQKQIILVGSNYVDPGYEAKTFFGKNVEDKVKITGSVDGNTVGKYYINYNLNYLLAKKSLMREVQVVKDDINNFDIYLNDKDIIYYVMGNKYEEKGGYALNKISNQKIDITNIVGNVDTSQVGEYEIKYTFEYNGEVKEKIRKVRVYDFNEDIIRELDNNNLLISIEISGINSISYIELPNGKKESNSKFTYELGNSGKYLFIVHTTNNDEIIHEINMDSNVNFECNGTVDRSGTTLEVTGSTFGIKKYEWQIDGNKVDGTNKYTSINSVKNAKVVVTLRNGLTSEKDCKLTDNLVYHFKYDENNVKPKMSCSTYTSQEKADLEAKLKKVVEQAGYGTRAGVVEAARFLVGALDYKVPYMGTKAENDAIGRYKEIGLNIGTSASWGCNVGGYVQGMDCTNFVMWAFYQNGIETHPYSHGHTSTSSVLKSLRVGDLLFTPCMGNCDPKFKYGLTHVGIIIGVDDNYFYVAEATTGSINAIVVSKWDKNNMPKSGKFSQAKVFDYQSDGNITNMWTE